MKRVVISFVFFLLTAVWLGGNGISAFQDVAGESKPRPTPTPQVNLPLAALRRDFKSSFPIPVGEKLEYEVRYSRFPIYATVGVVTFEYLGPAQISSSHTGTISNAGITANGNSSEPDGVLIEGLNVSYQPPPENQFLRLKATAVSKGILIAILGIDVKDRFETLVDAKDFDAHVSFKEIKEGKKHIAQTALFNHQQQIVDFKLNDLKNPQAPVKEKSAAREEGMLDLLSAFYFVRLQKMKEGQLIRFPVNDDGENYWFDIVVGKREKLKTDCGKVKTIKIEPKLFGPGQLFSRQGEMTMWVTDDNLHIPLKLVAKTSSGSVNAKLINFKNQCKLLDDENDPPKEPQKKTAQ